MLQSDWTPDSRILREGEAIMDENSTSWGWIFGGIGSIGGTLATAVATLYRNQVKIYETRIAQLEGDVAKLAESSQKCEHEHTATKIELATLSERLRYLENCTKSD